VMQLLMCAPSYYGIEYEINPWMSRARQSDPQRAQQQWNSLRRLLEEQLSVDVRLVDAQPGLPDMVFTANAGLTWKNKFIVSNFRYEVRRREAPHFEAWFRNLGFEIVHLPRKYYFEGEGDLLKCGESWFAGYHIRSDINAHQKVAEIIEQEILSFELTNEWFYHLDTCFCPFRMSMCSSIRPPLIPTVSKFWKNISRILFRLRPRRLPDSLATQSSRTEILS